VSALEDALMKYRTKGIGRSPLLAASILICGLFAAGCDEHVETIRNWDVPVLKHQTWAWRPAPPRKEARNERPVVSRDVMGGRERVAAGPDPANEMARQELRTSIERQLREKGLVQVSDPEAADFLVDYRFAMRGHNVTVERVYPGGYPGLVCGPYGCWEGWGYGPAEVSFENVRFREGTFALELVKRSSKELAYRARGEEPAHHATFSHDQVEDMVHAMLKRLKPQG
jgi:hypothetical protein